jgi:prepilin-type N-terminal cleavage/methylation domain-containing protein
MKKSFAQQGMTLIEMMIAMVISLVLIAGVGTVYLSSRKNNTARDQLSMMNENARVALETLRKHLEHAGYATPTKLPMGSYFYVSGDADPIPGSCGTLDTNSKAAVIASSTSDLDINGAAVLGDRISVRFIGDENLSVDAVGSYFKDHDKPSFDQNCYGGKKSVKDSLVYNAFHISTDNNVKDSTGQKIPILYAVGSNGNNSKQPVVNGIENMQFIYGVDSNSDGTADSFLNATGVSAGNLWQRVVSIKVALLVRSLEPMLDVNTAQAYNLLGVNVTPNDRYQRRVYSMLIQLRNVVEG